MNIPKLRSPIVLVHGLLGFNKIEVAGTKLADYFRGIPALLSQAGNRVLAPLMSPVGSVADRAKQLKDFLLQQSPGEPVHLIAHSMGGLDARYLISRLDMASSVLTLTTIATPHRGTSFADWGVGRFERLARHSSTSRAPSAAISTIRFPMPQTSDISRSQESMTGTFCIRNGCCRSTSSRRKKATTTVSWQ
jgi:triacylglycerol esterase/lipase EstA (alpha/beta hydrolase family)